MCILSIELVWVENMEKGKKNHLFWKILRGGTGTKQSGTGTISILSTSTGTGTGTQFSISDQC